MAHVLTLLDKKQLTHDVYELIFLKPTECIVKPGQFLLFSIAPKLQRAYSIAYQTETTLGYIIKRIEHG